MRYFNIRHTLVGKKGETDILVALLSNYGFDSFEEEETHLNAFISEEIFHEKDWSAFHQSISFLKDYEFTVLRLENRNWNKEWESNYEPIYIDKFCQITAPFHQQKDGFEYTLNIEPKMSFGTGHHDTTQLMIRLMRSIDFKNKKVLDMGSGTGVLSILANKMGAEWVDAVDIDDWAFENILENITRNNAKVNVHQGDVSFLRLVNLQYDIVLANINKNVLMADVPEYLKFLNKQGLLILSGFLPEDEKELNSMDEINQQCLEGNALSTENWMAKSFLKIVGF